jgi:hypothetical protein
MKYGKARWFLLTSLFCFLAACVSRPSSGDPAAAGKNVEAYLLARAQSNVARMISLSCAAWEPQARVEAASFKSMKAELDGVACAVAGSDGATATVHCGGRIKTTYNGDSRDWPLDERPFLSAFEGGEWRMCGYK